MICASQRARNSKIDMRQGQIETFGRKAIGMLSLISWQCASRAHAYAKSRRISALSVHQEGRPQLSLQDTAWLPAGGKRGGY